MSTAVRYPQLRSHSTLASAMSKVGSCAVFAPILAMLLSLGLAGCGDDDAKKPAEPTTTASAPTTTPDAIPPEVPTLSQNHAPLIVHQRTATPPTTATTAAAPFSLKIMTFNLGLLKIMNPYAAPDPKAKPGHGDIVPCVDERAAVMPAILAKYAIDHQLDVLGLEEVWLKPHADQISDALRKAGYTIFTPDYQYPDKVDMDAFFDLLAASKNDDVSKDAAQLAALQMPKISLLSTGLLLAVGPRFQLQHPEFHPFHDRGGFEVFAEKGFVTAELDTGAGQPALNLVLGHFQAMQTNEDGRPTIPSEYGAFKSQQDQVHNLISNEQSRTHLPAILFGDTNTGPHYAEKEFSRFSSEFGYDDTLDDIAKKRSDLKLVSWNQDNPLVKAGELAQEQSSVVDHVFAVGSGWKVDQGAIELSDSVVHQELNKALPAQIPLSDHYAVEVSLHWTP